MDFPGGFSGKGSAYERKRYRRRSFHPWVMKIPWRRKWQPGPYSSWEIHGQRSLVGFSPCDLKESDTNERTRIEILDPIVALSYAIIFSKLIVSVSF